MKRHRFGCIVVGLLSAVCVGTWAMGAAPMAGHHMAAAGDGVTSLDVYAEGKAVHLLIAVKEAEDRPARLAYLRSNDGGETFGAAVPVGTGQAAPEPAHRGMDAQIAASGDRVVAVWTTEGKEDRFGRGPMATAYSGDGGKTWAAGPNPSDDGTASGHAFVDVAGDSAGAFHLVWLDGRATGAATEPSGKGLRYAKSGDGGRTWAKNVTLDPATCECCWNTIRTGPDGKVYVLYRDREPRDMGIVASSDGGATWSRPVTVGGFGWGINGCPHVGGGMAAGSRAGETQPLYAIVWTAKDEATHGDYVLASTDDGKTWGAPQRLGGAKSWHADIACDGERVVAVWDAFTEAGTAVFCAESKDGAKSWSEPVRLSAAGTSATHPRVLNVGGVFRVFWTQKAGDGATNWAATKLP